MSDHESALQRALIGWLRDDATVQALLGDPARVWDQPPGEPVFPYLTLGRGESRPVRADGCGVEHQLTLACHSRFGGSEEARAVCAAVRARLTDAVIEADGVRTISLKVTFTDVFRSGDQRRTHGIMRVRAVTEASG